MSRPRIGISLGDPSGIGLEVTLAALDVPKVKRALTPVLFGDASSLSLRSGERAGVRGSALHELRVVSQLPHHDRRAGKPTRAGGLAQLAYVHAAITAAKLGEIDGICTAPVSKEAITKAGVPFAGHTEVLAAAFGVEVMMLMKGPLLSVALATNHLPLRAVPDALTVPKLVAQLELLDRGLRSRVGHRPRIAVCGLNPHASDGGVLGNEEARIISPAIRKAKALGIDVSGPFAADGLFANARKFPYDVALAMFHDQGLVATKTLDFAHTVNVTLGLPVPRTSPDHGVAYDIAGKGRADPTPMVSALLEAAAMCQARR